MDPGAGLEQLDLFRRQVDERLLFGSLSDRVRLASDEVEMGVIARFVRRITLRVAVGGERYARIFAG